MQLAPGTASWMPNVLANVLAGVEPAIRAPAALAALAAWALIPATIGLITVERRDVA